MPVESLEERTVEVLQLPEGVDEELLYLYFENKRRSGGGPLVSVEQRGDVATLVFEDAEAAAKVLTQEHHVLHNAELSVRRPRSKDQCRLLLRGINPNTITEMIELYVENMMGLNVTDYILWPSPERDVILIQLSQPLSKDFQTLAAKISRRTLDGATVTLEQVEETDSVLVENLHPGTTPDLLTLHFESKRGADQKVKDVTMLSEGTAKVSFVDSESLGPVLDLQHKLDGADLVVKPYFDFLQPLERRKDMTDIQMQTSPAVVDNANSQSSSQMTPEPLATHEVVEEEVTNQTEDEETLSSQIAIADPVKLALFRLSSLSQNIEKAHPNFTVEVKDDGVLIVGRGRKTLELLKDIIVNAFGNMNETHFNVGPEEAQFLARKDVKEHLLQTMDQTGSPTTYLVSGSSVVVASLSQDSANQTCSFLKSQLCHLSIPLDPEHGCNLILIEWSEFLQGLSLASVKVSERGDNIDVLTLKGMEGEKQAAILQFLSTPIEREMVISMEPGMLKYVQNHCHQLLADLYQVSIFPLEAEDVCGLKIHGQAIACQIAKELLQDLVSNIRTRTIIVNAPGVARFLGEPDCQAILNQMQTKFEVYINIKSQPWEDLPHQNVFDTAWTMMSQRNFQKVSLDDAAQGLPSDSIQPDQNATPDKGLLEEAKRIVSAIDGELEEGASNSDAPDDMENVDLYSAEESTSLPDQESDVMALDAPQSLAEGNAACGSALDLPSELEEEAQLSLAIQYSMDSSQWSLETEEEQLNKALELSRKMIQPEASSRDADKNHQVVQPPKDVHVALQETIKAANTIQIDVFAGYDSDLIRVDIAFWKKVSQRQVEEKVEDRNVKKMSEYHMKCLDMIKRKYAVEIEVQGTIITVSGFKDYVPGGVWDVKLLLEKVATAVSVGEILRTVQWVRHDPAPSNTTTPYSPDAIVFIESAWRMKQEQLDILLDNQPHTINFEKMQEHNVTLGKSVKISRTLLDAGDLDETIPEEEYSLLSVMPEVTKVHEESDEFQDVVKNFYATIHDYHSKIKIIQVEKLMNRLLYNQYKLKKVSVLQRATHPEVERTLYHGTNETSVKEICVHGFNRSFCGKNATAYGQGVYFAVNSALSVLDQYSPPNANGHKYIFVSKVLTGDFTKGGHAMKTTPLKETGDVPLRYDSVTDHITKPSMFVIFNDTQAFPEYLITCQKIRP